jgi:hypothetical protein
MVERKRMSQSQGATVLQKAMNLKKKKNLEPLKGNRFAPPPPQADSLYVLPFVVNIKIGQDAHDNAGIIENMIKYDQVKYDNFTSENPEILLPASIDIEIWATANSIKDPKSPCMPP